MEGYLRRTFDVGKFLRAVQYAAQAAGFSVEHCPWRLPDPLLALERDCPNPKARIYVSAGIHGDEPSGPLAILHLLRHDLLPRDMSLTLFPLLNPAGMTLNQRENPAGIDLNRDYKRFAAPETAAHREWLVRKPRRWDLNICLHEDWESTGYYVYEVNPTREQSLAPYVLRAVEPITGVDPAEVIDGWPAVNGLIRPQDIERRTRLRGDDCPESLYMMEHRFTHHSYTMESPSNSDLGPRIRAHVAAVLAAIEGLRENGQWFEI